VVELAAGIDVDAFNVERAAEVFGHPVRDVFGPVSPQELGEDLTRSPDLATGLGPDRHNNLFRDTKFGEFCHVLQSTRRSERFLRVGLRVFLDSVREEMACRRG
jgi:hypothetical protein